MKLKKFILCLPNVNLCSLYKEMFTLNNNFDISVLKYELGNDVNNNSISFKLEISQTNEKNLLKLKRNYNTC